MRPKHLLYSFLGHLALLLLMGFTASALRPDTPPPPGAIRVSFGELPRPGREVETELPEPLPEEEAPIVEETPAPEPEPEPEPEPLPPVVEETPASVAEEQPTPAAEPEPEAETPASAEPVRPVPADTMPAAAELPPDLPPLTEEETTASAPPTAATASEQETAPAATETPSAESAPRGASVQARGEAGAGDAYLGLVQSKIGRRWQPSAASTAGRAALETVVAFRIGARGQVIDPAVYAASGLSIFDREALRAVLESDPLPPPPTRFRAGGLNIQFTFTYRR